MIPDSGAQRCWVGDPELGAAPEDDGVVVEHGGHDESAVQQRGGHRGVPELAHLVAEPAMWCVPQEPLSLELNRAPALGHATVPGGGGGEGEEGAEHGGVGG